MMRLRQSKASLKVDRLGNRLVEDANSLLNEHRLQKHLAGVLKVQENRCYTTFVVIAIEAGHSSAK